MSSLIHVPQVHPSFILLEFLSIMYFNQLSGAAHTQKLVKIQYNYQLSIAHSTQKLVKIHNICLLGV